MNISLKIDTKPAVIFTNKLEQLSKSAFPNAVRNTLTRAARDVKEVTMPVSTTKHFVKRKPNFFKANSRWVPARGYNVSVMRSQVGFFQYSAKYNNKAVLELEQQEYSGTIPNRSFIPTRFARSGGNNKSEVLPSNRIRSLKKIFDPSKEKGSNDRVRFIRAAIKAGRRGLVMGNLSKEAVYRITSIKKQDGRTVVTKVPIYTHESGRSVRIKKATGFMGEASRNSARKIIKFYIAEANIQYKRVMK